MKSGIRMLAVLAAVAFCGGVMAQEECPTMVPAPSAQQQKDWTFLQLAVAEDTPSDVGTTTVCGVKVGVPISVGRAPVYGVEAGVLCAGTDEVTGLQASLITTMGKEVTGVQFGIVNMVETMKGLQLGIVNVARDKSFQIGLLNHIEGACFPYLPLINFKF